MLWACPIIVEVDNESVLELPGALQGVHDFADGLVHVIDHRGVDGLVANAPRFVIDGLPVLHAFFAVGQRPALLVDDAHLEHARVTFFAELLPAVFVALEILLDRLLGSVIRPVCGGEGDVLEERFVGLGEVLDLAHRLAADLVGVVVVLAVRCGGLRVAGQSVGVVVRAPAVHGSIKDVEAALDGSVLFWVHSEVPLADQPGFVTGGLEDLRDRDLGASEAIRVASAQHRGAGRPAARGVVEFGEAQASRRESVETGRLDLAPEASEVREAHVVGEDDEDVGFRRVHPGWTFGGMDRKETGRQETEPQEGENE